MPGDLGFILTKMGGVFKSSPCDVSVLPSSVSILPADFCSSLPPPSKLQLLCFYNVADRQFPLLFRGL